ncbi:molecular chaperone [Brenneria sp. 4F2]|nr:molecular chaperone [Brenneria bubanii]
MNLYRYYFLPGLLLVGGLLLVTASPAAINLDRTRVIFDEAEQSSVLTLINENSKNPFLAQSWLVDKDHKKISSPFTVLPPLQRIEANGRSLIRVVKTSGVDKLPQDRESLFYLNVREIPPKPEKDNVLQIAVQSEIKVFYRPTAIKPGRNDIWQTRLKVKKSGKQFIVENSTPYFITVSNILKQSKEKSSNPMNLLSGKAFMVEPKSEMTVNVADSSVQDFYLYYVNDYGGHPELHFTCRQNICEVEQKY